MEKINKYITYIIITFIGFCTLCTVGVIEILLHNESGLGFILLGIASFKINEYYQYKINYMLANDESLHQEFIEEVGFDPLEHLEE